MSSTFNTGLSWLSLGYALLMALQYAYAHVGTARLEVLYAALTILYSQPSASGFERLTKLFSTSKTEKMTKFLLDVLRYEDDGRFQDNQSTNNQSTHRSSC